MSKRLVRNTVRIEAYTTNGPSVGTGFFYAFPIAPNIGVPVIITCWHVVRGATNGTIIFANADEDGQKRRDTRVEVHFPNFEKLWTKHPDGKTDLAALPVSQTFDELKRKGFDVDFQPFSDEILPRSNELSNVSAFVNVRMIGYPIGIWDAKNDLPIVRTGTTATDVSVDFNGESKFLIDMAVFPGSSGSPVLLAEEARPGYITGGFGMMGSDQLRLLGIVSDVYIYPASGGVQIVPVPTSFNLKANVSVPSNLGVVIKAEKILDFEPIFLGKQH